MKSPSIGRIVHYVLPEGFRHGERTPTSHEVPAIITRTWGPASSCVQLTPFPDLANDMQRRAIVANECSSVPYDPTGLRPCSWHWPEDAQPAPLAPAEEPAEPALANMAAE